MGSIKKILAVFTLLISVAEVFCLDSGYFYGDGGRGKRVLVYSSKIENGKSSDEWIPQKVKRDFISDFVNYSSVDIIDSDEKATVLKLQKDSENIYYSNENPIELGKAIQAKSYIKLICTRKDSSFSLTATLTNIETGRTEGSFTSPFYSESDFITKVHGEASAHLLETLGVKLTPAGKRLLQYGSISNSLADSTENLETYKAELARLEKEQTALMNSRRSKIDIEAEKARIELQKATLLQQQKNEEEQLARLREDAKRKAEEEQLAKERSAEFQKKIIGLSKEIEEKASVIRQQKIDNMTVLQIIDVIEGEKQVLAENEKSIDLNIASFNAEQDRLLDKEINERQSQKPRKTEINSDGSLNDVGRQILNSDIEAICIKYNKLKCDNEKQLRLAAKDSEEKLKEKICSDIKNLESKTFTADSLQGSDLYFRVGSYDGSSNAKGWKYNLSFVFGGKTVYTLENLLEYRTITGKSVPTYPSSTDLKREERVREYKEYQDNVEAYDSFFRLNVPYIRVLLTYSVKSCSTEKASEYIISIDKVQFINVQNGTEIAYICPHQNAEYSYTPATLIDWISQREKDEIKQKEEGKARIAAERKRLEEERTRKESERRDYEAKYEWAFQKLGNGKHNGVGLVVGNLNIGDFNGGYLGFYADFNIFTWLFIDSEINFGGGGNFFDDKKKPINFEAKNAGFLGGKIGIGVNKRIHIAAFHPDLYYIFDIAGYNKICEGEIHYETEDGYKDTEKEKTTEAIAVFMHTVGIAITLFPGNDNLSGYELDLRYTFSQFLDKPTHSFSVGIRLSFPTGTKKRG